MPAPQLTWNADESRQALEVAIAIDAACKDAVRRDRERIAALVPHHLCPVVSPRSRAMASLIDAIRSGEPAPEAK